MKKVLMNVLGVTMFYLLVIGGILLLNQRFAYLNSLDNSNTTVIAMNK